MFLHCSKTDKYKKCIFSLNVIWILLKTKKHVVHRLQSIDSFIFHSVIEDSYSKCSKCLPFARTHLSTRWQQRQQHCFRPPQTSTSLSVVCNVPVVQPAPPSHHISHGVDVCKGVKPQLPNFGAYTHIPILPPTPTSDRRTTATPINLCQPL